VAKFVSNGMRRSEFCQSRGLSFSTLGRHLKKRRRKRKAEKRFPQNGQLVPAELARGVGQRRRNSRTVPRTVETLTTYFGVFRQSRSGPITK
jgi:hypothetical protein